MQVTPDQALTRLLEGNRRWMDGRLAHPNRSTERRETLANSQRPFATVFSCIDSRVPPEIVFDCGIGDLAVIRTGAHVLDDDVVMASVQFAAGVLETPLVLVLGHQGCGAVTAAMDAFEDPRSAAGGGLDSIIDALRPAYEAGDHNLESMVKAQTRLTVKALAETSTIADRMDSGALKILGGYYSFDTGAVSILD